jgi:arylsulfatase A-like enzyme
VTLDGVDLVPFVSGKNDAAPHETLFWRFGPMWAIRDGNEKLVHTRAEGLQLYDLAADVSEKNNLAAEKPEVVKRLQQKYDAWTATLEEPRWRDTRGTRAAAGEGGRRQRRRAAAAATRGAE